MYEIIIRNVRSDLNFGFVDVYRKKFITLDFPAVVIFLNDQEEKNKLNNKDLSDDDKKRI